MAMASMTINYARESVIDFTKPFMNMGIGILFKVCIISLCTCKLQNKSKKTLFKLNKENKEHIN